MLFYVVWGNVPTDPLFLEASSLIYNIIHKKSKFQLFDLVK